VEDTEPSVNTPRPPRRPWLLLVTAYWVRKRAGYLMCRLRARQDWTRSAAASRVRGSRLYGDRRPRSHATWGRCARLTGRDRPLSALRSGVVWAAPIPEHRASALLWRQDQARDHSDEREEQGLGRLWRQRGYASARTPHIIPKCRSRVEGGGFINAMLLSSLAG
jgi:hypothetical protein